MIELEQYRGLIVQAAKRQFGRLKSLDHPVEFSDLEQDATVVFLRCVKGYSVDKQTKFSTYLFTALTHHFNLEFTKLVQLNRYEQVVDESVHDYIAETLESDDWSDNPEHFWMRVESGFEFAMRLSSEAACLANAVCSGKHDRFHHAKHELIESGQLSARGYIKARTELLTKLEC